MALLIVERPDADRGLGNPRLACDLRLPPFAEGDGFAGELVFVLLRVAVQAAAGSVLLFRGLLLSHLSSLLLSRLANQIAVDPARQHALRDTEFVREGALSNGLAEYALHARIPKLRAPSASLLFAVRGGLG